MAEDAHAAKMRDLQQYIPFIENMISSLKDPRKKNRDAQLSKMEALHGMITDKKKRLVVYLYSITNHFLNEYILQKF